MSDFALLVKKKKKTIKLEQDFYVRKGVQFIPSSILISSVKLT